MISKSSIFPHFNHTYTIFYDVCANLLIYLKIRYVYCVQNTQNIFCLNTNLSTPVRRLTPMQSSPKYSAEGLGSENITRKITSAGLCLCKMHSYLSWSRMISKKTFFNYIFSLIISFPTRIISNLGIYRIDCKKMTLICCPC